MKTHMPILLAVVALAVPARGQEPGLVTHLLPRPCRVLDTREPGCQAAVMGPADAACLEGRMVDGETRHLQFQAGAACQGTTTRPVPLGARGLLVTLTAVEPTGNGHFILYDPYPATGETGPPLASSLNFTAGRNVAASAATALGQWQLQAPGAAFLPDAALTARVAGGGSVHVVLDVVGYVLADEH